MYTWKRRLFVIVLALAFSLSALGASAIGEVPPGATVQLSAGQAAFGAAQAVVIHVTVANPGSQPVRVLKWYTPAEEIEEALFAVARDGQPVMYLGAIYKRPVPKGSDYLMLQPGESFTRDIDLAAYYDFSVTGSYTVRYAVTSPNLYSEKAGGPQKQMDSMVSNELALQIEGRPAPVLHEVAPAAVSGSTGFNRCTTTQQTTLLSARANASTYAADALSYLNGSKQGPRYTTWFGVFTSSRYSTVTNHFTKISSAMDTAAMTIDCGCKKKYYAYVYANQPYIIYVCSVFWSAPMTGTDSKAGTLIHEMSHFNVVASTSDYVYGQTNAKALATSDPNKAINNADNHEYFAENNPAQP